MAQLTTKQISIAAATAAALVAASAGGDTFTPGDTTVLHVKNAGASPVTVTVPTPGNVDGINLAGYSFTVPITTGDVYAGPFPAHLFAGPNGQASVTYSGVTSVTVEALAIGV